MLQSTTKSLRNPSRKPWVSSPVNKTSPLKASMTSSLKAPNHPCSAWSRLSRVKLKNKNSSPMILNSARLLRAIMRTCLAHRSKRKSCRISIRLCCQHLIIRFKWASWRKILRLRRRSKCISQLRICKTKKTRLKKLQGKKCLLRALLCMRSPTCLKTVKKWKIATKFKE